MIPDHVTFRPGDLTPMLSRGGRAMGANAKRDLARYYLLVGDTFDGWRKSWGGAVYQEAWEVIVDYVSTRDFLVPPETEEVNDDFKRFLTSPIGLRHDRVARSAAATGLMNANWTQVVSIIHQAEASLGERTAGATSAT